MVLAGLIADRPRVPLATLQALLVVGSFASTLLAMAVESLLAVSVPDSHRGRAAGWFQAGNLGGVGMGGGLALWLVQSAHWSTGAAAGTLLAVCGVCCMGLLRVREPIVRDHHHESLAAHAGRLFKELQALVRSRVGALALAICFLPIGSGAAQNLWAAVAGNWHASAGTVALVNGVLGGIMAAAGCIVGGWVCDRMDRKTAYCVYGALQSIAAVAMAVSPRVPIQFVIWTMICRPPCVRGTRGRHATQACRWSEGLRLSNLTRRPVRPGKSGPWTLR
jgi:MFS family permease